MKIAIIGQGRFGKLLSHILYPYGSIFVMEKDEKKIDKKVKKITKEELKDMDWVILAVPISSLRETLKDIKPHLKKGSLIMDVCSVKTYPCRWLKGMLPRDVEILGTHPMFGPDSAKFGCKGFKIVICPVRISSKTMQYIKRILDNMGLKVVKISPEKHDKETAKSLALVHFLGRALGKMKIAKQEISTMGYERLLAVNETVNNDTWQLFFDMHRFNPYAAEMRKQFSASLLDIEKKIKEKKS